MTTSGNANNNAELPYEITVTDALNDRSSNRELIINREINDSICEDLDEDNQRRIVISSIDPKYTSSIETVGTVYNEAIDPDIGALQETKTAIGKTFCYSNHYNGVILEDNFYKIGTDVEGVYFTINKWRDVVSSSSDTISNKDIISQNNMFKHLLNRNGESVVNEETVYVPISTRSYRLCHKFTFENDNVKYIDCKSGTDVNIYVG